MKYNINELLDWRKNLEEKQKDIYKRMNTESLTLVTSVRRTLSSGKEDVIRADKVVSLSEFVAEFQGVCEQLAEVKCSITKYNANVLKDKLFQREKARTMIAVLKNIRNCLPGQPTYNRNVTRQGKEGESLEEVITDTKAMFERKDIDKMLDEFAKQERKLNTEIQKLNLENQVDLG